MEDKNFKGHLAMLGANITFGLLSPVSKTLLNSGIFNAYSLTMARMFGAAVAFWIASLFIPKETVPPKDMVLLFFASLLGIVINQGCFLTGVSLTSPIDASIVATTTPIITMIIAALYLKEPITGKKVIGIFIGAAGALLLILSGQHIVTAGNNNVSGDIFCLLAQTSFACYYVFFKKLIARYHPVTLMKWMFIYASICCVPFAYNDVATIPFANIPWKFYQDLAFAAFGATFCAYLLIPNGQKHLRPTVASMYNYVQPIVASLITVWLGMDTFGFTKTLAILLVFTGVYIVTRSKSKAQMDAETKKMPCKS